MVTKGTVTADTNAIPAGHVVGVSGNGTSTVVLTGTLTDLTAIFKDAGPEGSLMLPGLVFTPAANVNNNTAPVGPGTITVSLNDWLGDGFGQLDDYH